MKVKVMDSFGVDFTAAIGRDACIACGCPYKSSNALWEMKHLTLKWTEGNK